MFECNKSITNCCDVCNCLNMVSSDNSVLIDQKDCVIDLKFTPSNINSLIRIEDTECITFTKEFVEGILTYTPVIDYQCLADKICGLCNPSNCMVPNNLIITII